MRAGRKAALNSLWRLFQSFKPFNRFASFKTLTEYQSLNVQGFKGSTTDSDGISSTAKHMNRSKYQHRIRAIERAT